jgi:hypothetical protein
VPPTSTVILRLKDSISANLIGLGPARPRTRPPLPGSFRVCHYFISAIKRLRRGTRSPSPCRRCLGVLNDIYRRRCCRWRHCREHRYLWLPTEPERLSHHRAALRVSRGREGMIAPQSPSLQVFVPIERVLRADMPLEHFSSVAAIQANHIILVHGSPHRYSRCENFLSLNGLSEAAQRVMNCGD